MRALKFIYVSCISIIWSECALACVFCACLCACGCFLLLESIQQQDYKLHNMYTLLKGIRYGNCILYGDSIMNPLDMCVHVMRLEVLLLNGF